MQLLNNLNDEQLSILADIVDKHYCASKLGTKESCSDKPKHITKMPLIDTGKLQHPTSLMKRQK